MHRFFHVFNRPARRPEAVVVIWGEHSPDWMHALNPSAQVWTSMPRVKAVFNFSSASQRVPLRVRWGRRVVGIPLMESHIEHYPWRYAAMIPSREAVAVLGDKARFADYVAGHGLGYLCPKTYASLENASFPCVIKRTNLNGGHGVERIESLAEARRLVAGAPYAGHPWIVQALVPMTVEYVVHCVCRDGRIVWHVSYACDFKGQQIRRAGNATSMSRSVSVPARVLRDLEALLSPLDYSGPCSVDCTWDDDGRLTVFEINPRMGGSLMKPTNTADLAACLSVILDGAKTSADV